MQALREAAEKALAAPSIFNTQPWRWQISDGTLRLWADRERQLLVADPDARMLTISCGVALHHARVALAAAGHQSVVRRLPDLGDPDLLAEIRIAGRHTPTDSEVRLQEAIRLRHTDRRAFSQGVPVEAVPALIDAAESQQAHLHLIRPEEVATLALAAVRADAIQLSDGDYRRELIRWTHRPQWSNDGVPTSTAVERAPRAVPVRDFAPFGQPAMPAGPYSDVGAQYAVFFTDEDGPADWIQAGEALSAVLLTATSLGLSTAPISDVTELAVTREQLRHLLADIGVPQLAVRIGQAPPGAPPSVPRRNPDEVIYP
jgi:nitroreductase